MPSGKTHALHSSLAAAGLCLAGLAAGRPPTVAFALAGGCLAGILLTPDLDVDEPVHADTIIRTQTGLLPWLAWRLFWWPYARLIPHRSWLSHGPIIGTGLRLAYLAALPWLVFIALGIWWPWSLLPGWVGWAVLGLAVSDALHWAADRTQTSIKRWVPSIKRWVHRL